MLMTSSDRPVTVTQYETALALRRTALLQPYLPKYLLAPEVAVLLHYLPDERQRMLYATLWNTGARITEALTLTPEDLQLEGPRPCVRLRTLKQRQRGRGRPSAAEKIARIVPLLDAGYVDQLRRFLATFRPGRRRPLFDISAKWHLNRSRFGIRIDHDLASISDRGLASQSITIWHASDH